MATQPEEQPLELTEELEIDPSAEQEQVDPPEEGEEPDEDGEETVVSFGDEGEEQPDESSTIRHLREKLKEQASKLKALERTSPAQRAEELGPEPTIEDCDFDGELLKQRTREYDAKKRQIDEAAEQGRAQQRAIEESWEAAKTRYSEKVKEHAFPDYQDAQDMVEERLGVLAPVILKAASDPALIVYALGKNPAKLTELAKFKDGFELAAAIARMEGGVKVLKRRKGPAIDSPQTGSAPMSATTGMIDKQLEKLETESERTGDRTKIRAFKKKHGLL